jgi:hypothetical protein
LTLSEQRDLLRDCLRLWDVAGQVVVDDDKVSIVTADGTYTIVGGDRSVRWFLRTPDRPTARAVPSIVALLSRLRNALGAEGGAMPRIG